MTAFSRLLLYVQLQRRDIVLHISLLELWNCVKGVVDVPRLLFFENRLSALGLEMVDSQVGLLGLCQEYLELRQFSLWLRFAEHDFQQITQRVLQRRVALSNQIVLDETTHVHNLMWGRILHILKMTGMTGQHG